MAARLRSSLLRRSAHVLQRHGGSLRAICPFSSIRSLSVAADASSSRLGVHNSTVKDASSPPSGLFQLPQLFHPRDFKRLTEEVKTRCVGLKHEIVTTQPGLATIQNLDEISNAICSVIDAAELCRNVHPDESFRVAASACFTELSDFIQNLNADVDLYNALRAVSEDAALMQTLTEEQRRMAVLLRQEFERDGIHLSDAGRRRVIQLQNEITQLSMDFQRTMHTSRDFVEVPEKLIRPLPHGVLAACERKLLNRSVVRVPTDLHVMNTVLKWVGDPNVRREMYLKGNACAKENLVVLGELREKRHALAQHLGFESFSHFAMSDRMMTSPDDIEAFVTSLSKKLMPKASQELQVILSAKMAYEARHGGRIADAAHGVAMWDLPYYMGMLKAQRYRIDSRVLSGYFPLERCLDGLALVCRELFGLELASLPMDKHEAWHQDVRKLGLQTPQGDVLGVIYFDLYPRPHKYNHAAHFTIRCGKRHGHGYQTPLVALVCNFNRPAPYAPSLLTHSEVETLFHEFGHALHSLLSRTEFQHLSGTRASLDFVETPSHLFEYFAWDYRVVREFARHHETNEPIPRDMMLNLKQSKHMFAAMDAQTQCLYSLLDLSLFGRQPLAHGSSTATLRALQNEHTLVPHVDGTFWHTRFGHLVGYGAGYYSYLYARVFASEIWNHKFQDGPLDRLAGSQLYQELLIHGGAKDPNEMLRTLLDGAEPSAESYLHELGIDCA